MRTQLGAHETMEIHEVLSTAVNGINLFQLYRQHATDQQLQNIMDKQMQFAIQEYNSMVQAVSQRGMTTPPNYRTQMTQTPTYGIQNQSSHAPVTSANQISDKEVASGILSCHKASASLKMVAALECADPEIRRMMQQSAINCSEQAYEIWQYMNQKGYYQVPTMQEQTTLNMINSYTPMQQQMQANQNF